MCVPSPVLFEIPGVRREILVIACHCFDSVVDLLVIQESVESQLCSQVVSLLELFK